MKTVRSCVPADHEATRPCIAHRKRVRHQSKLIAGVRNLPIAPTIRFEIPIVESAASS